MFSEILLKWKTIEILIFCQFFWNYSVCWWIINNNVAIWKAWNERRGMIYVCTCLKTLFNIVEDWLKKLLNLNWCLCSIMFRRVNNKPGMQKFWNWCSHYQENYDWISPLNKRSGWPFYSNTVVYEENEYGESGHLSIFSALFWST